MPYGLVALRKFEVGLICCSNGLLVDAGNTQILSLREKCSDELLKLKSQQQRQIEINKKDEEHWTAAWRIISGAKDPMCTNVSDKSTMPVAVGYASTNQQPAQLQEVLPHFLSSNDTDEHSIGWPVVLLYPQYSQIDVIQGVAADDMLAMHLAEMFPELADLDLQDGSMAVSWDRDREYQVSRLAVYAPLEAAPRINTIEDWLNSCREQKALRGELGAERRELALEAGKKRSEAHELKLSQFDMRKSSKISKTVNEVDNSSNGSSSGGSDNNNAVASLRPINSGFDRAGYLDVHLGCNFQHVLAHPDHVLAGGLLTLLIFVRGNSAHTKFLQDITSNGHGVWTLNP